MSIFTVVSTRIALGSGVEIWISPQSPAETNAPGTPKDPYKCPDGASLDTVLEKTPAQSTIHFLPGVFLPTNGITIKPGWKLRGAGIDNTIIRLAPMNVAPHSGKIHVLGAENSPLRVDGAEVSDLTVDCNLQNQTNSGAFEAVVLAGSNTRISRVHAINWGSTKAGDECFVIVIAYPAGGVATNCVIEDCAVDTPAPVMHVDGTTAISIFSGTEEGTHGAHTVGAEIRGNIVSGVTANSRNPGSPKYINAYCLGTETGYLHDNRAMNLAGGVGYYQDTWSGADVIIARNDFEDVLDGILFNLQSYHMSRLKIISNVITPTTNGCGISYYTGNPSPHNTNVYAAQLLIKDNVVQPYQGGASLDGGALELNGSISATVVGNILDGGANGPDVWIGYQELPFVKLDTMSENYNLQGTALRMCSSADYNWRPSYVDVIQFTPQMNASGWYRILSARGRASGVVGIYSPWQSADRVQTDVEFAYQAQAWTSNTNYVGDLDVIRKGSFPYGPAGHGGAVTKVRVGSTNPGNTILYLDIYVQKTQSPQPITVRIRGYNKGMVYNHPQLIATPPPVVKEMSLN
ncbi:MAG TPA: hypothetical protein VN873_01255 [Candidatus Angelobacter sp.]|nr:hypothetical protein [Candidatus Angelobacter sp.]